MPAIWVTDLVNRPGRILSFSCLDAAAYLGTSLETLAFWSSLLVLAAARRGWARHVAAMLGAVLAALLIGGQLYFFKQYGSYVNPDAAQFGAAVSSSVLNQLRIDALNFAHHVAGPAFVALLFAVATRKVSAPGASLQRLALVAAPASVATMLLVPCSHRRVQAATPDVLLVQAFAKLASVRMGLSPSTWRHPTARTLAYLPALRPEAPAFRSVLLIVDEGIRFDVACAAFNPACETMPFSNRAAPDRIALLQLRAVDSTTAVSLAVLWSGLSPLEPIDAYQSAPLVFDFAHAAGFKTAFVSAQDLDFAKARAFFADLPLDRMAEARDLAEHHDVDVGAPDESASRRMVSFLRELGEPFFAAIQYANAHYPYRVDDSFAPFQPCTDSKAPEENAAFFNRYRNAVVLHDRALGELIESVRAADFGPRTVIVYTSDHGEAFREHNQLGHGLSIFDEEVHVPGWVDAPDGTLTQAERARLAEASTAFIWHLDIAPTLLDLMGVWDALELRRHRLQMPGTSLLRGVTSAPVAISNCAAVWGCPFRSWGMMQGSKKLEAREWDGAWHCFDVLQDPAERRDLGAQMCGDLAQLAEGQLGGLPRDGS
ncbi:MAG: sulfatase-like hydrolase/transferase [Polyangiaceae bacterium]|nr:sulfatase-like hydrolase/transferase [Polyangiaceae bacterium]